MPLCSGFTSKRGETLDSSTLADCFSKCGLLGWRCTPRLGHPQRLGPAGLTERLSMRCSLDMRRSLEDAEWTVERSALITATLWGRGFILGGVSRSGRPLADSGAEVTVAVIVDAAASVVPAAECPMTMGSWDVNCLLDSMLLDRLKNFRIKSDNR